MDIRVKALLWAAAILASALLAKMQGIGDGAYFGIIAGLSGAAITSLHGKRGCGKTRCN